MCPTNVTAAPHDKPCADCGSRNHGTSAHARLETAFRRFEPWGIGLLETQEMLSGNPGEPSPFALPDETNGAGSSVPVGLPPDQLRIVRSIISHDGLRDFPVEAPAISRLWRRDPAGGFTFMLSSDGVNDGERESLERLFGDRGSPVTVELRFSRTTRSSEPRTT